MPYIKPEERIVMDGVVDFLKIAGVEPNGKLNYILYAFCKRNIEPSYNNYKNYLGELEECVAEIRRRILSKYEDEAIARNGDVD